MYVAFLFLTPQYIVAKLFWPVTALLESVGLHEPPVDSRRERVCRNITQSLIPLAAYARKYQPYLELMNLDIKAYIQYVWLWMMHPVSSV